MNKKYIFIGVALVLGIIVLSGFSPSQSILGQIATDTSSTNTSSTVGVVAVKLLAESGGAQLRSCTNMGTSTIHYFYKNATSTGLVALTGQVLWASSTGQSSFELTEQKGNLWLGDIWGMTSTGTTTISCLQM